MNIEEECRCNCNPYCGCVCHKTKSAAAPLQSVSAPDVEQWMRQNKGTLLRDLLAKYASSSNAAPKGESVTMSIAAFAELEGRARDWQTRWKQCVEDNAHYTRMMQAKVAELQKWKESQIAVTPDMQEIAKLLNVPLGKSVHDRIIPGILELRTERDGLREALRVALDELHEVNLANSHGSRPRNPEMTVFAEVQARAALGTESTEKG